MKNIHLLKTDKPSRFLYNSTLKSFCVQKEIDGMFINDGKVSGADFWGLEKALNNGFRPYNIYITNSEKIKIGDWYIIEFNGTKITKCTSEQELISIESRNDCKKIILTTNPNLIKDGVQAIDDEFLEWFVKNPSCEVVEVKTKQHFEADKSKRQNPLNGVYYSYKIIIPKEEPKQETLEEAFYKTYFGNKISFNSDIGKAFELGAKWQQEQDKNKYSEEEVLKLVEDFETHLGSVKVQNMLTFKRWFKQFKNK